MAKPRTYWTQVSITSFFKCMADKHVKCPNKGNSLNKPQSKPLASTRAQAPVLLHVAKTYMYKHRNRPSYRHLARAATLRTHPACGLSNFSTDLSINFRPSENICNIQKPAFIDQQNACQTYQNKYTGFTIQLFNIKADLYSQISINKFFVTVLGFWM